MNNFNLLKMQSFLAIGARVAYGLVVIIGEG